MPSRIEGFITKQLHGAKSIMFGFDEDAINARRLRIRIPQTRQTIHLTEEKNGTRTKEEARSTKEDVEDKLNKERKRCKMQENNKEEQWSKERGREHA